MALRWLLPFGALGVSLGLESCALKAHPVPEPATTTPVKKEEVKPTVQEPLNPAPSNQPNDGIRLPGNMLALPQDKELKATNPAKTGDGSVISKPPVEKKE